MGKSLRGGSQMMKSKDQRKESRIDDDGVLDVLSLDSRVKLLMKGTELSYQERECILYNLFDKFAYVHNETLYEYYWKFSQLINDMHTIGIKMQQVQVNTMFLNALLSEWSKFVTNIKLAKSLYTTNYDQLYSYLSQHERHANEVRIKRKRYLDPLALVANSPTLYNPSQLPQYSGIGQPFKMAESQFNKFKTEDLDAYDSDCDDLSSAKAVVMANLLSCDSDVPSKVPYSDSSPNDMINQDVQEMHVIVKEHDVIYVINDEETLILKEESRSKMLDKQNDQISIEKKTAIDYSKLNKINEDFALKNELRKLKGKNVFDTVVSKPSVTIALGMFKLDVEPISHRLKNNRDAHEVYLEKTIENTDTLLETLLNMSPENKEHYQSEKEEIHLLLTGIRDELYSTVDACKIAHDMWIAIK
nr:hypothetical protein [Tanacetum cinerariifolium]